MGTPFNSTRKAIAPPDLNNGDVMECDGAGCEVANKNGKFAAKPNVGAEYWDGWGTLRYDYDHELAFVAPFIKNWSQSKDADAFGVAQWYFADTPARKRRTHRWKLQEPTSASLNGSMTDINRFPRLMYYVYKAAWTPFKTAAGVEQPVVALAHHWNRSGTIQVNAFSNCPSVGLLINGVAAGPDQVPNPWNSDPYASLPDNPSQDQLQATTSMPFQTHWNVNWVAGTVVAQCKDELGTVIASDQKTTAGPADSCRVGCRSQRSEA